MISLPARFEDKGRVLEQEVAHEFENLQYKVTRHPSIRSGSTTVEPDLLVERNGIVVGIEVKAGPATISDVGLLANVKAYKKLLVSEGVASPNVEQQAIRLGVIILDFETLRDYLGRQSTETKNPFEGLTKRVDFLMPPSGSDQ